MAAAPLWTASDAAAATGGRVTAGWAATGVSIDSRTVAQGDLFVAIRGPSFDGHAFVAAALQAGAAAALVSQVPDGVPADAPLLLVDDTFLALNALAAAARRRTRAKIVAVTGSVGKTSSKEALRLVLSAEGRVHAAAGSQNNHWGVPLTLARLPADADFGVFEIGMNHAGEISPLSRLVRPQVALITTVEAVHLENFANLDAIALAKAEIFDGLCPGGSAVLNRDNKYFTLLAERAGAAGAGRIVSFGADPQADARQIRVALHPDCSCISAVIAGQPMTYKVGAPGRHWVNNSLGVLAAAVALGADLGLAGIQLAQLQAPPGRGQRHRLALDRGAVDLIDDSYNASPASMRAALDLLAQCRVGPRGRRIAVLGDMLELGASAGDLHAALAADVLRDGIDLVYTVGEHMHRLHSALPPERRGLHADSAAASAESVLRALRPGDAVLVKGSHGSRMERVVERLLQAAPPVIAG